MLEKIREYISQERIDHASHAVGRAICTARRGITQFTQNPRGALSSTIEKIKQAYNTAQAWVTQHVDTSHIWSTIQQFGRDLRTASVRLSTNILHPIMNA